MTFDDYDLERGRVPPPDDFDDGDDFACGPLGCNGACDSGRCWFDEVEDEWAREYEDAP